jgi:hypothetical protein
MYIDDKDKDDDSNSTLTSRDDIVYLNVHIYIYIYMYVCLYIYICIYIYAYTSIHAGDLISLAFKKRTNNPTPVSTNTKKIENKKEEALVTTEEKVHIYIHISKTKNQPEFIQVTDR